MSKFSTKKKAPVVLNHMGAKAFKQSAKEELAFACVTTFLEDSYYEKKDGRVDRIVKLIHETDPVFVAKLAVVARREFHMRSVSHLLLGELSKIHKGDSLVKDAIVAAAERPDDLMEIVAYIGTPLPKQVKRGIRNAILKFDRYQLAKYKGEGNKVSLVDLFNLTHPKVKHATKEQKKAWKDLLDGNLASFDTWEVEISGAKDDKARTKAWESLVADEKLGYMALIRNLNNFIKYGVNVKTVKAVAKMIADPDRVKKSKQLPFRFLSAFSAVTDDENVSSLKFEDEADTVGIFKKALSKALDASIANLPDMPGRTLILTDNSGSMRGDYGGSSAISAMSKKTTANIANLFAAMYWMKANSTLVGVFGDRLETPKLDREKDIFGNYKIIDKVGNHIGGGTETGIFTMFKELIKERKLVDRIVIFSDSQVGTGCGWYDDRTGRGNDFNKLFQEYKKISPKVKVYSVDLKGYGNSMFQDDVYKLAGWSDKIFDLMSILEKGDGLVKYINDYELQA